MYLNSASPRFTVWRRRNSGRGLREEFNDELMFRFDLNAKLGWEKHGISSVATAS